MIKKRVAAGSSKCKLEGTGQTTDYGLLVKPGLFLQEAGMNGCF